MVRACVCVCVRACMRVRACLCMRVCACTCMYACVTYIDDFLDVVGDLLVVEFLDVGVAVLPHGLPVVPDVIPGPHAPPSPDRLLQDAGVGVEPPGIGTLLP
jgi:hypothetical protein